MKYWRTLIPGYQNDKKQCQWWLIKKVNNQRSFLFERTLSSAVYSPALFTES